MKKIILYLFLISGLFGFAQTEEADFERMVEAEMKSASSVQAFAVNPNTLNYDITYHELRFTVDPAVDFITGQVTSTFTALANMNTVTFDLTNELTVSSVTLAGNPLTFVQNASNELVITLPSTLTTGNSATVVINYSGVPSNGEAAFTQTTHSGTPIISEPFGARDWWPCKQDLNDKIDSFDIYITCPDTYIGVSNGLLQSSVTSGGNVNKTFSSQLPNSSLFDSIKCNKLYYLYAYSSRIRNCCESFFPINNYLYPESNTVSVQNAINQTVPHNERF
jgi:hypothetical protein